MEPEKKDTNQEISEIANNFPFLNLFKIINLMALFMFYVGLMWFYDSHNIILKIIAPFSFLFGIATIFIPAKKSNIKAFKQFSSVLYIGLVLSFII